MDQLQSQSSSRQARTEVMPLLVGKRPPTKRSLPTFSLLPPKRAIPETCVVGRRLMPTENYLKLNLAPPGRLPKTQITGPHPQRF